MDDGADEVDGADAVALFDVDALLSAFDGGADDGGAADVDAARTAELVRTLATVVRVADELRERLTARVATLANRLRMVNIL